MRKFFLLVMAVFAFIGVFNTIRWGVGYMREYSKRRAEIKQYELLSIELLGRRVSRLEGIVVHQFSVVDSYALCLDGKNWVWYYWDGRDMHRYRDDK